MRPMGKDDAIQRDRERDRLEVGFLGFQVNLETPGGSARGALMVTDFRGDPLEFQVSSTVTPNRVQHAIWGDRLTRRVVADLLAAPLLDHMRHRPKLVMASHLEALLTPRGARSAKVNIAHLHPESDPPLPRLPHIQVRVRASENPAVGCLTMVPNAGKAKLDYAKYVLDNLHSSFDLFTVFDRISLAISELDAIEENAE